MVGTIVNNYRVIRVLSEGGGMGIIYLAEHVTMGQQAVIKQLRPEFSGNAEVVARFLNEARAAAAIKDPGIVTVFDQGTLPNGSAYITMELLIGETLRDRLKRERNLPPPVAAPLARQAARAVNAAHRVHIIHRDLKPENLFLCVDPELPGAVRVKVLDFGIAKLGEMTNVVTTRTNVTMGTAAYMAPEQWRSAKDADARSDIYAMGCVLYEMLLGTPPFPGPELADYMDQHRFREPVLPGAIDPSLAPFDYVIRGALAKSVDDRLRTFDDFIAALPQESPPVTPPRAPWHARRGAKWVVLASAVGGTLAALALWPPRPDSGADARPAAVADAQAAPMPARPPDARAEPSDGQRAELDALLRRGGEPETPPACQARDARLLAAMIKALQSPGWGASILADVATSAKDRTEFAEYHALLARAKEANGEGEAALELAQKAVRLCPDLALAYNVIGNAEQKRGHFEGAEKAYREAMARAAEYRAPIFNSAVLAVGQKKYDVAVELLGRLLALDPTFENAHLVRGQAHLLQNHFKEAIGDFEAAVSRDPANRRAWLLLGQARLKAGLNEAARGAFCRAEALGSTEAAKFCRKL